MKIYIDLLFTLNFFYDFILLLTVAITLKRKTTYKRLLISSVIGSLSTILLIIKINKVIKILFVIIFGIIMLIIAFKYICIRYTFNNILYLYMCSVILAGFLYFLKTNYKHANEILLIIISPIILYLYIICNKKIKKTYNYYYHINICFEKANINCLAFLDSGNNLIDPITKKSIIILNPNLLKNIYNIRSPIYVPYNTINGSSIMKCYKPSYIIINNHKIYNYLVGEANYKFSDGVECLLNNKLLEDNYV